MNENQEKENETKPEMEQREKGKLKEDAHKTQDPPKPAVFPAAEEWPPTNRPNPLEKAKNQSFIEERIQALERKSTAWETGLQEHRGKAGKMTEQLKGWEVRLMECEQQAVKNQSAVVILTELAEKSAAMNQALQAELASQALRLQALESRSSGLERQSTTLQAATSELNEDQGSQKNWMKFCLGFSVFVTLWVAVITWRSTTIPLNQPVGWAESNPAQLQRFQQELQEIQDRTSNNSNEVVWTHRECDHLLNEVLGIKERLNAKRR